jgi:hypothetical protein
MPISVTLDVPRVQYFLYLLDAFYRGLVPSRLIWRWFGLVNERNGIVIELLRRELQRALVDLGCGHRVSIRVAENFAPLESLIARSITTRVPLGLGEMTRRLSDFDPIWMAVLGVTSPATHQELIYLSYAVEQLRLGVNEAGGSRCLTVVVDNASEWRATTQARAIAATGRTIRQAHVGPLLGIYPLERAFTSEATGRTDLYYHDPGREFIDSAGRSYDIPQLLARIYPERHPLCKPAPAQPSAQFSSPSHASAGGRRQSPAGVFGPCPC